MPLRFLPRTADLELKINAPHSSQHGKTVARPLPPSRLPFSADEMRCDELTNELELAIRLGFMSSHDMGRNNLAAYTSARHWRRDGSRGEGIQVQVPIDAAASSRFTRAKAKKAVAFALAYCPPRLRVKDGAPPAAASKQASGARVLQTP